jgi:hypothetical protein
MEPDILVPLSELGRSQPPAAVVPSAVLGEGRQIEEPAGLADFLASRVPQGAKSETVAFRRNAKGEEETLWTWNNEWPTEHDLGGKFGGGKYRVVTTILGTGAKKAPKHEWSFILPAYPWDSLAAANRAKEEAEARNRAVAAIPAGGSADFRSKLEELVLLRQTMAEPPRPSFFDTDAGKIVGTVIAAALPKLLERLISPPAPINQKDPSETFRETLAMTSQMLSIHKEAREIMQPAAETEPEAPSWMSQAVGLLNDLAPVISGILATPAIMRPQGMLNRAQAAPEVKAAQGGTPFERQTLADEAVRVYGVKGAQELFAELKIPADGVEFRAQAQEGAEG